MVVVDFEPLAGRECGSCNVCCIALTIEDPALQKVQGFRCCNAQPDNRCGIYPDRPQTCRVFNCGWRLLKWVRDGMRPDRSGVLVRLQNEVSKTDGAVQMGVVFTLLNAAALKAEGLAESVAAAVAADRPVYLDVPGPPGRTSGVARMNEALGDAVHFKNKAAVLDILRRAYALGRAGENAPIVLRPRNEVPGDR